MPRRPNWVALGILSLFIVILSLPMLSGKWLASPHGDQYSSAYAFYSWEAAEWRATGSIPLWNPMIMGGLPFLAVVAHGDILYPTALLRNRRPGRCDGASGGWRWRWPRLSRAAVWGCRSCSRSRRTSHARPGQAATRWVTRGRRLAAYRGTMSRSSSSRASRATRSAA